MSEPREIPPQFDMIEDAMARVQREKTEAERFRIANGMWVLARDTIRHMLRQEHPDWDEARIQREIARRMSHGTV